MFVQLINNSYIHTYTIHFFTTQAHWFHYEWTMGAYKDCKSHLISHVTFCECLLFNANSWMFIRAVMFGVTSCYSSLCKLIQRCHKTNSMFSSDIICCILREISWKQNYVTVKMIPTWSCCSRRGRLCALTSGSCSHRSGASSWTFNTKTQIQLKQTENKFVEDLCDLYWVSRIKSFFKKRLLLLVVYCILDA